MTGTADEGENDNGVLGSYRWNRDEQAPSLAIVDALADLQDTAPTALDALYESIDPRALDDLLSHEKSEEVAVEFRRGDYQITVRDDGEIQIRAADDPEK